MADATPSTGASSATDVSATHAKSDLRAQDGPLPLSPEISNPKQDFNSPSVLQRYASATDQSIVRLQRLLTTATGLDTFLSTLNYTLYILAYLEAQSPSKATLLQRLLKLSNAGTRGSQNTPSKPLQGIPPSATPFGTLASLISDTRITLRLTALLPLYVWLRKLVNNNGRQDRSLRAIALAQCISYIIFQFTENVVFLADRGIVSRKWLEKRGGSAKWWLWSSRAWLIGVCCDLLRLFREAVIDPENGVLLRRTRKGRMETEIEKQQKADRMWWSEVFVASCWLPVCLHYSLQNGLKGVNSGVIGLLGFMAGAQSFMAQWAKTKTT
ncbi:hypothetical protein EPUS_06504 [Endocarpon pusillum Z07020]|uniref:Peroxin 11C n=1 Tax=Endocarpon pusillum (strain Z07020 / HMAS-L-300199) TaxID=1263415 RepID=U1HNK2_ENDPU|nr:uncharacterized protein EPUS_06504 [Endocarpon pusillum Z07020]ERF71945.1 hypothetical protein EPUS_06504 [Endocarpon pusillum Z07020]